jgi:hypothetical protein
LRVLESYEKADDIVDLSIYTLAARTLFKFEDAYSEIDSLCDRVFDLVKTGKLSSKIDDDILSGFLSEVVRIFVQKKRFSLAHNFLRKAEGTLLDIDRIQTSERISPIPLDCYRYIIVRNWYTDKTAPRVVSEFKHLLSLYRSGFENLLPDAEIYTSYLRALATINNDVAEPLQEMIELYTSTNKEELKPTTQAFNVVLLAYSREKANSFKAGKRAINLLDRMFHLGLKPDTKTLNYVLHNLTRGQNKNAFRMASAVMEKLDELGVQPEPDSFTLHYILDACGGDSVTHSQIALKKCLSTFREIRQLDFVSRNTYGILSKVLCHLLEKGPVADKVLGSVLELCCEDGRLDSEVKDRFRSKMSKAAWIVQYVRKLNPNGEEPAEWTRNTEHTTDRKEDSA